MIDKALRAAQWALAMLFLAASAQLVIAILRIIELWREHR